MSSRRELIEASICDQVHNTATIFTNFSFVILIITVIGKKLPYGRHATDFTCAVSPRLAWFLQGLPALSLTAFYFYLAHSRSLTDNLALLMFASHFWHRILVYPFFIKSSKPVPLKVLIGAMVASFFNGFLTCAWHTMCSKYPDDYLEYPGPWIGIGLFFFGMYVNISSDHVLSDLRRPGRTNYKIPRRKFFQYVTCANYFGEILEWAGFALFARSPASLSVLIFYLCILGPRALHHHSWYLQKFPDYPKNKAAFVPFLV